MKIPLKELNFTGFQRYNHSYLGACSFPKNELLSSYSSWILPVLNWAFQNFEIIFFSRTPPNGYFCKLHSAITISCSLVTKGLKTTNPQPKTWGSIVCDLLLPSGIKGVISFNPVQFPLKYLNTVVFKWFQRKSNELICLNGLRRTVMHSI